MARIAVAHVSEVFESQVVVLLPDADGPHSYPRSESISGSLHGADLGVAQWVQDHGEPAGLGTNTLPGTEALYLPLLGSQGVMGVLAVLPANPRRVLLPEQFHLLETFAGQIALGTGARATGRARTARQYPGRNRRSQERPPCIDLARLAHTSGGHCGSIIQPRRSWRTATRRRTPGARPQHLRAIARK